MFPVKNILTLIVSLFATIPAISQIETFGVLTYTPPPGWQREATNDFVKFTEIKNQTSYCLLLLYPTRESQGSADKDFEKDWSERAVKHFNAAAGPAIEKQKSPDGWDVQVATSSFTLQGNPGILLLTVISGHGKSASIMAATNDTSYLNFVQEFLGAVDAKMENITSSIDPAFINKWAKSASSPPRYTNGVLTNVAHKGYYKGQYDLKADSTYVFTGESYNGLNKFGLIDENGKFMVDGQQITFIPAKSTIRVTDLKGNIKKTQGLGTKKRVYDWQFHYFEGINETNLVLTAKEENIIDGGFLPILFFLIHFYTAGIINLNGGLQPNKHISTRTDHL